nr:Chain A, Abscisic acid receptor PYL5 [Oryza sativa]6UOQ_A Chain A, Abscisic acid receptor PYL5 [Oryza sativa]6UOR_A Chain A, Abscisic acid receptor PYL5 [Oryza sativa]6UOS_A Chain A, Abscisic acid receptor PYL5 [Oryza sativa]6UOU_A Chain A, Abscisic acid receptor PYL5 [Oryza sativa]6UOW_A Chain A, Abscisic acid receptor PYL5 [Oryza sativa]
AVAAGA